MERLSLEINIKLFLNLNVTLAMAFLYFLQDLHLKILVAR